MARSRTSFGIFLPVILVLVASAIWSIAWYYIAGEADKRITIAIDEASGQGWTLECGERTVGGFPFRIEFVCTEPQLVIEDDNGRITVRSQILLGVAMAYNLDQIIVDVTGPTMIDTFELGGLRKNFAIVTQSARASFGFADARISAVSVVVTGVDAGIPTLSFQTSGDPSQVSADRAAFHVRRAENAAWDVAFTVDKFRLAGELAQMGFEAPELAAEQVDFLGQVTKTDRLQAASVADALIAWQGQDGQLSIQRLMVDTPALDFEISGVATLDTSGEVEGSFRGIFGKLDQLIDELKARGVLNDESARLAAGAVGLLAKPVKDSSKVQLPVSITGGEVFIGPVKTMILPPLF